MKTSRDLTGLIKFLSRDDWAFHFEEVMGDHFSAAMDEFDLEYEEIGEALGDHWTMTLWGCAFEDFLTQVFDPDGETFVDAYLKRRSWKENAQVRAYMKALSVSVMSLYEVSEVVPGQSFLARDLIRGGEPVLVSEGIATKTLQQWERIAARIVPLGDRRIIAGGLLPFSPEASDALLEGLRALPGKRRSKAKLSLDEEMLRAAAFLFTRAWLFDVLPKVLGVTQPAVHNSDGDEIVFHEIRFPLEAGTTSEDIATRLAGVPDLRQENAQFWNWLGPRPHKGRFTARAPNAIAAGVTMEDGTPVLGNLELKGRFLVLSVNSASRATKGTALLKNVFGKMVRTPLTTIQTIEQMKASRKDGEASSNDEIPLEVATPLVHAMLDKQYREILDEPIDMLGNTTPRAAVQTKKGREKVAEWLKYLEFRSASAQNPQDPMATYDFGWMWRELKIENLRC